MVWPKPPNKYDLQYFDCGVFLFKKSIYHVYIICLFVVYINYGFRNEFKTIIECRIVGSSTEYCNQYRIAALQFLNARPNEYRRCFQLQVKRVSDSNPNPNP